MARKKKVAKWATAVFLVIEAALLILGFANLEPAHVLKPIAVAVGIAFVAVLILVRQVL
jgi:hypothetical protein